MLLIAGLRHITLALKGENETHTKLIINTRRGNAQQTVFIPFECVIMWIYE